MYISGKSNTWWLFFNTPHYAMPACKHVHGSLALVYYTVFLVRPGILAYYYEECALSE